MADILTILGVFTGLFLFLFNRAHKFPERYKAVSGIVGAVLSGIAILLITVSIVIMFSVFDLAEDVRSVRVSGDEIFEVGERPERPILLDTLSELDKEKLSLQYEIDVKLYDRLDSRSYGYDRGYAEAASNIVDYTDKTWSLFKYGAALSVLSCLIIYMPWVVKFVVGTNAISVTDIQDSDSDTK